nr:PAS domain S-box protein [Microcoleus sp. FACHB-68]
MNRQLFSSVGLELKGGTPEKQLGSDGFEAIHPDDIQKCKNIYQSAFEECRHFQIEYRRKDAGGEYRWILETGIPQFSPAGDLLGYIGTCFDITDEKRHLSEDIVESDSHPEPVAKILQDSFQFNRYLWENYSLLQTVIEGTPDIIFVKDTCGCYVTVNSAFTKLFGKAKEEILDKDDSVLFPPELAAQIKENDRRIIVSGEAQTLEEVMPINGARRTYLTTKSVWRDREGNVIGLVGISRDISSRKQAEEALRLSEQRLKLALEAADNGVWDWNITTGEAYFSPQFQQMLGYEVGELEAHVNSWVNLVHPDDQPKVQEALNLHLEGRTSAYQTEFRMPRKSGEWQWIFSTGKIVERDEAGKPLRMLGTHQDITERKQAEKEEQKFIALIEGSYDFVGISNLSGEATYLNEAGQKLIGLESLEQVKNTKIIEFFFPEDRAYVLEQILPTVMEQGRWEGEVQFRHFKTGAAIPVIWNVFALKDPQTGEVYGIATVTRDISERKALEKELERRQARFDAFFSSATAGMVILDEQLRYTNINAALAEMNGVSMADSIGKTVPEVLPDVGTILEATFQTVMTTGQPILNIELNGETPKQPGVERHWMVSYFPLPGADGTVLGVGGVVVEITERKRAEEALREYQEHLEELVTERTALLTEANEQLQQQIQERQQTEVVLRQQTQILAQIHDAVITTDLMGVITSWNNGAERVYGYSATETIGQNIAFFYTDDELPRLHVEVLEPLLAKGSNEVELKARCKCGKIIYTHLSLSLLRDSDGAVTGMIGYSIDITARKELEKELALRQARFDAFFTTAPAGLCIFDEQLRYVQINETLADFIGMPVAECLGRNIWEIIPELAPTLEPIYNRILTTGEPVINIEIAGETQKHPGVTRYWINSYFPLPGPDGKPLGLGIVVIDITERKQAEAELQQSYNLLNSVLESTPDLIFVKDLQGRYVMLNSTVARILKKSIDEVIGKTDADIMPAPLARQLRENDLRIINRGVTEVLEEEAPENGQIKTYLSSKSPWRDLEGNVVGLIGMSRDISERKQIEEALRDSEERFRRIVETAGEGIWSVDADNKTTFINQKMADMLGYTVDEVMGQPMFAFMDEEGIAIATDKMELRRQRINEQHDFKFLRKDGSALWVIISSSALTDEQGRYAGALGMLTDITDRKETEAALVRSEQALRQQAMREKLINRLAGQIRNSLDLDTILETSVQEIRNLLQIDWCTFNWVRLQLFPGLWETVHEARNPALPSLLGSYPLESMNLILSHIVQRKTMWADDIRTIDDPQVQATYLFLGINSSFSLPIQTQSCEDIGVIVCNHTQPRLWREEEVELLQAVGDQLAIAMDQARLYEQSRAKAHELEQTLHQLQRTQTQLIQSEKMSSLGQLVAGVAHEINNPVNFIYGNLTHANDYTQDLLKLLQLYQETYQNPTPAIQEEIEAIDLDFMQEDLPKLLSSMKIGADRIREIVLSLRTFSRLDEAEMKEVDIHEGVESTLLILANRLKAKSERRPIEIVKEYGSLPLVECYAGSLNQVFMNILTNAIDALEEYNKHHSPEEIKANSNQIKIHTEVIARSSANEQTFVRIAISDNGPGMSEQVRSKLFDPFFTTKPIGSGTGLGLSISYQIVVEKHHGSLRCFSAPGEGAKFVIEIPVKQSC